LIRLVKFFERILFFQPAGETIHTEVVRLKFKLKIGLHINTLVIFYYCGMLLAHN